jgi:sugar/nucleoside kinase (ribokinase family)
MRNGRYPADVILGAGDTFIAGVLFGLMLRSSQFQSREHTPVAWSMQQLLRFANELAGHKVLQWGFDGLSGKTRDIRADLDRQSRHST